MILKKLKTKQRICNTSLNHGKKKTSEKNLLKSFKKLQKTSKKNHIKILIAAIKNTAATLKMNKQQTKRKKKKFFKEIPVFIKNKENRVNSALKVIVNHSILKTDITNFYIKFSSEILDSASFKSLSITNKTEIQKQILKKKMFFRFKWKN